MHALVGLSMVEFRCPKCQGTEWGSDGITGRCEEPGILGSRGTCTFTWSRRHDHRVFFRKDNGAGFASREELEAVLRLQASAPTRPPFELLLHELLGQVMHRPPTLGVVALWSRHEQRQALHWVTHEILAECVVAGPGERLERPRFIEEGAATA